MAFKISWVPVATIAAVSVVLVAATSTSPSARATIKRASASPAVPPPATRLAEPTEGAAAPPAPTRAPAPPPPPSAPGCGPSMARVGAYCIDKYEAFLVRRGPGGEEVRHPHFERPEPGVTYEAKNEAGAFPQAYVSRVEAAAACAHAGKRLCTLGEWRAACEGPRHTIYPYGATREGGRCNTEKAHLLTLRFGADARHWRYEDFNDPSLDQEPGFLAKSGAYDGCVGDYGVYDLIGNLHEWVSDDVDRALVSELGIAPETTEAPAASSAPRPLRSFQPWQPGNGVFMGGFFSTREENGAGCGFTTIAHEPEYHDYSTGFRCCADAAGG